LLAPGLLRTPSSPFVARVSAPANRIEKKGAT
jgi:hypothetical protein